MNTFGSFFSGGGGMDIGAVAAGWQPVFANEYDERIATVYIQNLGDHMIAGDLLDLDVRTLPSVRWFHASPPCPNFSTAKTNAEETANDLALAKKTAAYIIHHLPNFVTIENVYGYRKSKSWRIIARALQNHGYLFNYWHVCMADYGVPQTRHRMIAVARRDGIAPRLPNATHAKNSQPDLFGGGLRRWVSWYEAIEDLIPTLPDSEFAPWQLAHPNFPQLNGVSMAIDGANTSTMSVVCQHRPHQTITASFWKISTRIWYAKAQKIKETNTREYSRFQSFPDTYQLPESNSLACRIIGNAVPPLFAQRLGEYLIGDSY